MAPTRLASALMLLALSCSDEFRSAPRDADATGGNSAVLNPGLPTLGGTANSGGQPATGGAAPGGSPAAAGSNSQSGGASGAPSSAGAPNTECAQGTVKFVMTKPASSPNDYCVSDCFPGWLEIATERGTSVVTSLPCGAVTCADCQKTECSDELCLPRLLSAKSLTFTWDGSRFLADSCGSGAICQMKGCVAEASYQARMCAPLSEGKGAPECIASERIACSPWLPFRFPSDQVITGELAPVE